MSNEDEQQNDRRLLFFPRHADDDALLQSARGVVLMKEQWTSRQALAEV
jgi:hypothetical protein